MQRSGARIVFGSSVPMNMIVILVSLVVVFFASLIIWTFTWGVNVADSAEAVKVKIGPEGPEGKQGICNLTDPNQTTYAGNLSCNNLIVQQSISPAENNTMCLLINFSCTTFSGDLIMQPNTSIIFGADSGISTYYNSSTNVTYLVITGNVLFNSNTSIPLAIPLPFPIGNGGFLAATPGGGLAIIGNNGITLNSSGSGISGRETFLDDISFNGSIVFPCGTMGCFNGTLTINAPKIALNGTVDLSWSEFINNFTWTDNQSGILFGNGGFVLPGSGACILDLGPSACIDQLVLQSISQLVLLSNAGFLNLSQAQVIIRNLTVLGNLNLSGLTTFPNIHVTNNAIVDNLLTALNAIISSLQVGSGGLSISGGLTVGGNAFFGSNSTASFAGNQTRILGTITDGSGNLHTCCIPAYISQGPTLTTMSGPWASPLNLNISLVKVGQQCTITTGQHSTDPLFANITNATIINIDTTLPASFTPVSVAFQISIPVISNNTLAAGIFFMNTTVMQIHPFSAFVIGAPGGLGAGTSITYICQP